MGYLNNSNSRKEYYYNVPEKASMTIPDHIDMTMSVFKKIKDTIGRLPAETGGILGMRGNQIDEFFFDAAPNRWTRLSYTPNTKALNRELSEKWTPSGTVYMGAIHSHPIGLISPSYGDEAYAKRLLDHMKNFDKAKPYFYIPIVLSAADTSDGEFRLYSYIACYRHGKFKIEKTTLYIDGQKYTPKELPIFRHRHYDQNYGYEPKQQPMGAPSQSKDLYMREAAYDEPKHQPIDVPSQQPPVKSAAPVRLVNIEVSAMPRKTLYKIGENLDTSGIIVTAVYSDSSTKDITSSFTIKAFSSSRAGPNYVNISYEENGIIRRSHFKVAVVEPEVKPHV